MTAAVGKKVRITPPSLEPITSADAKLHVKQDETVDDDIFTADITIARQLIEEWASRAMLQQTWDIYWDRFPCPGEAIILPMAPVSAITHIKYTDENGVQQTWDPSKYTADLYDTPQYVVPAFMEVYPVTRKVPNAVVVRIVAGYGTAREDVPEPLRQAVRLLLAWLYEHRGETPDAPPTSTLALLMNDYVVKMV